MARKIDDMFKTPLYQIDAEQAVLGGLILNNDKWEDVSHFLKEGDFYDLRNKIIFSMFLSLAEKNKPFDTVLMIDHLKNTAQLEKIGGEVYLYDLMNNTPHIANIMAYAEVVRDRSILRQLYTVTQNVANQVKQHEGRSSAEILSEAESEIFKIANIELREQGKTLSIQEWLGKTMDRINLLYERKNAITGLSSGFIDLDRQTAGLQEADLVIVAGRPSMGKTAFAMNIVEDVAIRSKEPVLVFSLEMPGEALTMRLISSLSMVSQQRLRTGQLTDHDWARIPSAVSMLSEAKLFIDDTPALSPADIRMRARRIVREQGKLGLIVIDYLQLMQVPEITDNRVQEVSHISRSLKALAKELKVPVIALSQLSRNLESRSDRRPIMSDLRESGAIEQDADLILFIYRDEVYNKDSSDKGTAEIIIGKQRNGPIGTVRLAFSGEHTKFDNYASHGPDGF
jgi:replicative DNA helicase